VDGFQRCARQFQLPGRFQRDRCVVAQQGDGAAVFLHRGPAEALQALQQGFDAALTAEGRRPQVVQTEAELFMLGADTPGAARFFARSEHGHQLGAVMDGGLRGGAGAGQRGGSLKGDGDVGLRPWHRKGEL